MANKLKLAARVGGAVAGSYLLSKHQKYDPQRVAALKEAAQTSRYARAHFDRNARHEFVAYGWRSEVSEGKCGHIAMSLKQNGRELHHFGLWPNTRIGGTPISSLVACKGHTTKKLEEDVKREEEPPTHEISFSINSEQAEKVMEVLDEHHEKVAKGEELYGFIPPINRMVQKIFDFLDKIIYPNQKMEKSKVNNCTTVVGEILEELEIASNNDLVPSEFIDHAPQMGARVTTPKNCCVPPKME